VLVEIDMFHARDFECWYVSLLRIRLLGNTKYLGGGPDADLPATLNLYMASKQTDVFAGGERIKVGD